MFVFVREKVKTVKTVSESEPDSKKSKMEATETTMVKKVKLFILLYNPIYVHIQPVTSNRQRMENIMSIH